MRDLFQSNRGYPLFCKFWSVKNESNTLDSALTEIDMDTRNSIIHKRVCDGTFFARIDNEIKQDNNVVGGSFMFEQTNFTISTRDLRKDDLKNNDIVVIENETYIVEHIDRRIFKQQQLELGNLNNISYITYISLRK